MATAISSSLAACRRSFNELLRELEHRDKPPEGLSIQDWNDERGRLRLWAANIGAHQTGQSSLDFRLRDSSHIQQQIIRLLDDLLQRLQDVKVVLAEGEDSDVESLGDSSSEGDSAQTEIQQLRRNVATIINCLFEMSILVRRPAQHDVRMGSRDADLASYEWADIRHVRDKFPKADEEIVSHLGRAITRRRRYLKYRERHAAKLKQGIDKEGGDNINDLEHNQSEVLSETVATNFQSLNIRLEDHVSESGFTQTSYASSLISGNRITIPAPPQISQNSTPFECPYCFFIIIVKNTKSWNSHVFHDLLPYMCTELECKTPGKLYATRHEWTNHLQAIHTQDPSHDSTRPQREMLECKLCGETQESYKRYQSHVARHLQELALFILPRSEEDSNDDEGDGESNGSQGIEMNSEEDVVRTTKLAMEGVPGEPDVPPNPPQWLVLALQRLQQDYPQHQFEATMRVKAFDSITKSPMPLKEVEIQKGVTYRWYPRIRCSDCFGKTYRPGPGLGVDSFKAHLKNRLHQERVISRVVEETERKVREFRRKTRENRRKIRENSTLITGDSEGSIESEDDVMTAEITTTTDKSEDTTASGKSPNQIRNPPPAESENLIILKDALGRRFELPFFVCREWIVGIFLNLLNDRRTSTDLSFSRRECGTSSTEHFVTSSPSDLTWRQDAMIW